MNRNAIFLGALLLAGCATAPPGPPAIQRLPEGSAGPIAPARTKQMTLDEVVAMARDGTPSNFIIQTLRDTRASYALSAGEGQSLAERGVPAEVVAYLRGGDARPARRPRAYDYPPYYASAVYPYGWGYPGWGYPYGPWHPGTSLYFGLGRRW